MLTQVLAISKHFQRQSLCTSIFSNFCPCWFVPATRRHVLKMSALCSVYCSAWSRLKLNTKIGLNHHHHPPTIHYHKLFKAKKEAKIKNHITNG